MAMQMQRAFNARMLTKLSLYVAPSPKGYYDDNNHWVKNSYTLTSIRGVIKAGNKFSQFDEGQAIKVEDGGTRVSDYRTLYVTDRYPVNIGDKLFLNGDYFNVLQRSDEETYGFYSVILEKSEGWTPP